MKTSSKPAKYGRELLAKVIEAYGGKCSCCGEMEEYFLDVDSVDHGFIPANGSYGKSIYRWLEQNRYPDAFHLVCHNCKKARQLYGFCPHTQSSEVRPSKAPPTKRLMRLLTPSVGGIDSIG
jgi:hypothetical protein